MIFNEELVVQKRMLFPAPLSWYVTYNNNNSGSWHELSKNSQSFIVSERVGWRADMGFPRSFAITIEFRYNGGYI